MNLEPARQICIDLKNYILRVQYINICYIFKDSSLLEQEETVTNIVLVVLPTWVCEKCSEILY